MSKLLAKTFPEFIEQYPFLTDETFPGGSTHAILGMIDQAPSREAVVKLFRDIHLGWTEMKKMPSGPTRAKKMQEILSGLIQRHFESKDHPMEKEVSCRRGCSACCHQEVMITDDEAILLSRKIKAGHEIDRARLKVQSKWTDHNAWKTEPKGKRACVFLKESECSIYEDRPLACRKFFVQSPPKDCDDINGSSMVYSMYVAETFVSSALNLKPDANSMAKKLLERL